MKQSVSQSAGHNRGEVHQERLNNAEVLRSPAELTARQFDLIVRRLAEDLTYGSDLSRFVGSGTEYAQTRLFALGDPVRSIDWRVTARTGRAHVKDYQATKRVGMFIVVDTSASMRVRSGAVSKLDVAVWIAAVLSVVALARRSPVAIIEAEQDSSGQQFEPTLSYSRVWQAVHALRARANEAAVEPTDLDSPLRTIEGLAETLAAVVVISDLHALPTTCSKSSTPAERSDGLASIKRLAGRHDCMVAHVRDPAESEAIRGGFCRAQEPETGRDLVLTSRTRLSSALWGNKPSRLRTACAPWGENIGPELIGAGADYALFRTDRSILEPLRLLIDERGGGGRKNR